ncbi:exocyst complex component SEC3-like [Teratosphaeria destructans]|uniref:Exocyst complex component SEC3-like n=1 Tax=Teratosphaeria destructans TaxID=418781 RepID=A0A9W7W3H0_9PEZI|nr:exocyst complex component SEC3-like [Teratosphaeria destructans]
MSRAERFEDEKRRLVQSCFSKTDASGQLAESYITHIRIQEDAHTGRVRMHKARENTNGSFSIGKTWNLEELTAIESFASNELPPRDDREAKWRQWAGPTGFIVTIAKPYYWQAMTGKEKDFFIASTVKIYRKYTKGNVPDLRGFDERAKASMLGVQPGQSLPPPSQPQLQPAPPHPGPALPASLGPGPSGSGRSSPAPPHPPFVQREQSREGSRYRASPGPPPSVHDPGRPAGPRRPSNYNTTLAPGPGPRQFASQEQMRAPTREAYRNDYGRPGTSPAPGQGRTPPPSQTVLPLPNAPYAQSQRSGSPVSSLASNRDMERAVSSNSPARQRNYQPSVDSASEDGRSPRDLPQVNGGKPSGADLFQATKQRWMTQAAAPAHHPPPRSFTSSAGAPPLSPLDTSQSTQPDPLRTPVDHKESEASDASPGINLEDAAAVGALTSYWGPEPTPASASPKPAITKEPASPPTPERSNKRPPMSPGRNQSRTSVDLRPAPLRSPVKAVPETRQPMPTDATQPEIEPLAVQSRRQSREVAAQAQMPGAFDAGSPAVSPAEERGEPDAQSEQPSDVEKTSEADDRPGLGPMVKKDVVRGRFAKAANAAKAANIFKPRPGGAAEKILRAKAEREAAEANGKPLEPDGITAVVPRPQPKAVEAKEPPAPAGLGLQDVTQDPTPKLEVSSPESPPKGLPSPAIMDVTQHDTAAQLTDNQTTPRQSDLLQTPEQHQKQQESLEQAEQAVFEQNEAPKQQVKLKRRSQQQERNLAELGIDKTLLEGRCLDFEETLNNFGWTDPALTPKKLEELEADLRREVARVEAGYSLAHNDPQRDDKVAQVDALLDRTIQECDELEGLLTLYNVELSSLAPDIAFIEAQSQGLQVQSANQKLLYNELQKLLENVSLDRRVLEPLRHGQLDDLEQLQQVEGSLIRLYNAIITIDPSKLQAGSGIRRKSKVSEAEGLTDLSVMHALREKKDLYERESNQFCQRVMQVLDYTFRNAFNAARSSILQAADASATGGRRLNKDAFNNMRQPLWAFSPEILFMKELNQPAWATTLRMYHSQAQPVYTEAFKENLVGWKRAARKPSQEEAECLFTTAEKEEPVSGSVGLAAARKLTVKRSQTLAKTLRSAGGNKSPSEAARNPGAMMTSEVFSGAMDEMAPLISQEQNFIMDLFHLISHDQQDFLDAVTLTPPAHRNGTNLMIPRPFDANREMARRVTGVMDDIFRSFVQEMGVLLDWAVSSDPIQGVGIMVSLSKHSYYLQDTSQEFLVHLLDGLTTRLHNMWAKFVDDQVRAIEEKKVKIKKRKGVIGFMKTFPQFSASVENVFAVVARDDYDGPAASMYEVRQLVDQAYARINRAMFDSLKVIAKESPTASQPQQTRLGDDSEDKEMLNYHILLIENMNHYIEDVDDGNKEGVLAEWKGKALLERAEAMEAYTGRVLRRPLGKLLDFLDSVEALLQSHSNNPTAIAARPSTSRKQARQVLATYDSKEIRRGIETLRKRIEKHFGDADEENISRDLVDFVVRECERSYEKTIERAERIIGAVYPAMEGEKAVELGVSREEIRAWFGVR